MYDPSVDSTYVLLASGQVSAPGIKASEGEEFTNADRMADGNSRTWPAESIVNGDNVDKSGDFEGLRDGWRSIWRVGIDLRDGTTFLY